MSTVLPSFLVPLNAVSAATAVTVMVVFLTAVARLRRRGDASALPAARPRISVLIPARNEGLDLPDALPSVLAQQHVDLEVFLINDHSTDETGPIAHRLAAADPRLRVLDDPPLREGWFGKCNALQHGWQHATADWIVLTDADVVHAPTCFATALEDALRDGDDLRSYLPRLECRSTWETIILPIYIGAVVYLYHWERTTGLAAGAFTIVRRDVLEQIGGFREIRQEMLDDIALGRQVRAAGFQTRFEIAVDQASVRLFKGNRDAFWGTTKNILGFMTGPVFGLLAVTSVVVVYLVPLLSIVAGLLLSHLATLAGGLAAYAAGYAMVSQAARICRFSRVRALLYPLVVLPITACTARALYFRCRRGSVHWRGRTLPTAGISPVGSVGKQPIEHHHDEP